MSKLLQKLWKDDCGALISMELLFVATILIIGLVVGLTALRDAIDVELSELANAILALSQGFTVSGLSGCCSEVEGSATIDTPSLVTPPTCTPPTSVSVIDIIPCT